MKHQLIRHKTGLGYIWECEICALQWLTKPGKGAVKCPGQTAYRWRTWPDHLMLKTELDRAGYSTTAGNLPPVVALAYSMQGHKWYNLYDVGQAVKKRPLTDAQRAAAERRANHRCRWCNRALSFDIAPGGLCKNCQREHDNIQAQREQQQADHASAAQWARDMLAREFVILDTETTGLENAEIVEIAIIDQSGQKLMNQRLKPFKAARMTQSAIDVHGITLDMLADAPTLADVAPRLAEILNDAQLVIYNAGFDWPIIQAGLSEQGQQIIEPAAIDCAMLEYAAFVGDWSNYFGNYKYQRLPGGDHSAMGDCRATLDLIRYMADEKSEQ